VAQETPPSILLTLVYFPVHHHHHYHHHHHPTLRSTEPPWGRTYRAVKLSLRLLPSSPPPAQRLFEIATGDHALVVPGWRTTILTNTLSPHPNKLLQLTPFTPATFLPPLSSTFIHTTHSSPCFCEEHHHTSRPNRNAHHHPQPEPLSLLDPAPYHYHVPALSFAFLPFSAHSGGLTNTNDENEYVTYVVMAEKVIMVQVCESTPFRNRTWFLCLLFPPPPSWQTFSHKKNAH